MSEGKKHNNCRIKFAFLLIVFILNIFLSTDVNAKAKITPLNFRQDNHCKPIAINSEEILFLGGINHEYSTDKKTLQTKIYNIKTKKMRKSNSKLNKIYLDGGPVGIQYDDNHVLIHNGKIAEIYNIKEDKYTVLDKNIEFYFSDVRGSEIFKVDNRILLVDEEGIIEFLPETKTFKKLVTFDCIQVDNFQPVKINESEIFIHCVMTQKLSNNERREYIKRYIFNVKNNSLKELYSKDVTKKPIQDVYWTIGTPLVVDNQLYSWGWNSKFGDNNEKSWYKGAFYKVNLETGEVEKVAKTRLGASGGRTIYIGNNQFLLLQSVIDPGSLFTRRKFIERAILDLNKFKVKKVKITHYDHWELQVTQINDKTYYVGRYHSNRIIRPELVKIK